MLAGRGAMGVLYSTAAEDGCLESASALLEAGCQPDVKEKSGIKAWLLLQHAALGGLDEIARALLIAGVYAIFRTQIEPTH